MYHPVLEDAAEDHEFVELHNAGAGAESLTGWKLLVDGQERFVFPAATLEGGEYRVVARNREKLAETYGLRGDTVFGDYRGELDNGGAVVALADASGATVDVVKYDDRWPWPAAADAMGGGEAWLPADQLPLERHRHRGRSLERYDATASGRDPASWEAS